MYCNHCGSTVPDGTKFCPSCGTPLDTVQPVQNQNASAFEQPMQNQPSYQQPNVQPGGYEQGYNQAYGGQRPAYQQPAYPYVQPMNWYKFLIYFALFAGAVLDVISAICTFTGVQYNSSSLGYSAKYVYYFFPGLRVTDIIYGILLIALAVFAVYTRFRLSGYKQDGPKLLLLVCAANLIIPIIYIIAYMAILMPEMSGSYVVNLVGYCIGRVIGQSIFPVVMIIVNKVYFDKRKHLFVN